MLEHQLGMLLERIQPVVNIELVGRSLVEVVELGDSLVEVGKLPVGLEVHPVEWHWGRTFGGVFLKINYKLN